MAIPHLYVLLLGPAAQAEAPEYLLGDLGVRLDLPKSRWHMTRWSDSDFQGKVPSDPILLYAWATPVRAPVDPPDAWGPVYTAKIEELQGTSPEITTTSVHDAGGRKFAWIDARFELAGVGRVALRGATTEIDGMNFHVAVVAPGKLAGAAERERERIATDLELTAAVPDAGWGGTVEADGMTTQLPEGWRAIADVELPAVTPRLIKLGLENLEHCWTAVHPIPGEPAEVMVSCPKGPLRLGVVDAFSFDAGDALLREKLFGLDTPAERVDALDRTAFLYAPRDGLAFGALPDGDQVRVIWALGDGALGEPVRAALRGTRLATPHAVTPGEQVGYYLRHRPLSAPVLCPVGCLCAGAAVALAAAAGLVALRARRRPSDEDDG